MMPLLTILLVLIAVGVLLWLINTYGGQVIDPKVLKLINIVAMVIVVIWLLRVFGVWAYLSGARI